MAELACAAKPYTGAAPILGVADLRKRCGVQPRADSEESWRQEIENGGRFVAHPHCQKLEGDQPR